MTYEQVARALVATTSPPHAEAPTRKSMKWTSPD